MCPGIDGKPCRWSVDTQNEPCLISRGAALCEICRAKGDFNLNALSRQLRSLYDLDPDVYKLALNEVPRYLRSIVLRGVMEHGACRPDARSFALAPSRIKMLTKAAIALQDRESMDILNIQSHLKSSTRREQYFILLLEVCIT